MDLLIENLNLISAEEQQNTSYRGDNLIMHVVRISCTNDPQTWPSGLQLNEANDLQYLTGNQTVNNNYKNFIYLPPDAICSQKNQNSDGAYFSFLPKISR